MLVDFVIRGLPERPPSISMNFLFCKFVLSIVVFVAITPLKIESFINSIIESIDSFGSSGDIFKKRGILISSSIALLLNFHQL